MGYTLSFPRMMTPSPWKSRMATARRLTDTPTRRSDIGLPVTPETTSENGVVARWDAEAFESSEVIGETNSASEIVSGRQDDNWITDRIENVSDHELKTVLQAMQKARLQVLNSTDIDMRTKKCMDAMIREMVDDFNQISRESFIVDYLVCSKVVLVYSVLGVVFYVFWLWSSGPGSCSPGLPPT